MMNAYDSLLSELKHAEAIAWDSYETGSATGLLPYSVTSAFYDCWRSVRQAIIFAEKLKE